MYLMRNTHVVISLLTIIQNSYFVSLTPMVTNERVEFSKIFASFRTSTLIVANVRNNVSLCTRDITLVSESAIAGEKWALQMLDASSKIQAGILKGNVHDLGMYDQCIEVKAGGNSAKIKGQSSEDELSLTLSMCLPSSCNEGDVHRMISGIIDQTPKLVKPGMSVAEVTCSRAEDQDFTSGETLATFFLAMVVIFLIFCTICEWMQRTKHDESIACTMLAPFSLYTSSMDLLSTKSTPEAMPAIHGLRVLSISWVIIVHRCFITSITPMANLADVLEIQNRWYALFSHMITFTVDTSFVVSGFLASYHFLKSIHSGTKISLPMIYLHRYIRLTPSMAMLILLTIFQLRHIGSGPVWKQCMNLMVNPCKENWWANLLYVQNIVNAERMCLPHTWYLAAEMQLFWISRIILHAAVRWPKHARRILVVALFTSIIVPPVLFAVNRHTNAFFKLTEETSTLEFKANIINVYMSTIHRAAAYLVGVALGYLIVNTKIHLTMLQVKINWAIACVLVALCVLATHHLYSKTYVYDLVFELVYAALARPAWAIAISWIIYACTQGYGVRATNFLSSPVFFPLSRLSYCIYLVHLVMQASTAGMARTPAVFTKFQIFHLFWGDIAISVGLAFLLSVFSETPVTVLERILKNNVWGQETIPKKSPNVISHEHPKSNGAKVD